MKRILRPISYILAAIYFCADLIFARVARPISTWIARQVPLRPVRDWICSLSPYPSLALFSVPVILLEPVKFVAAYLAATGNLIYAGATFVVGEILKLVMIERLFDLTRKKLLKIPAFAFGYGHYMRARTWIMQTEAVQTVRTVGRIVGLCVATWQHHFADFASQSSFWPRCDSAQNNPGELTSNSR
jgi:hypothetical protein